MANSALAMAEPEPLTLANLTTKSLTRAIGCMTLVSRHRDGAPAGLRPARACARQRSSACVMSSRNFCMSQAPVGQRSAHSPQCRQTSSSLAMMRPVLSGADT